MKLINLKILDSKKQDTSSNTGHIRLGVQAKLITGALSTVSGG